MNVEETAAPEIERQTMEVDIACAGFGPAMGGFLTTLTRAWNENPADPAFESKVAPGMPLQVLCYERADDIAAGVSGVVTRGQGIRASFPDLNPAEIPMAAEVKQERVLYLLDPIGASRRSFILRTADAALRTAGKLAGVRDDAFELPWTPAFLHKHGGLVMSIGQFNQWAWCRFGPACQSAHRYFQIKKSRGCASPTRAWTAQALHPTVSWPEWMSMRS
jgi:electron-transferring-flavoprotein dehydrogenase